MSSISKLADLSLLAIFGRLPLRDLIRAGQVCNSWRKLCTEYAQKRKIITLVLGDEEKYFTDNGRFGLSGWEYLLNDDGSRMFKRDPRQMDASTLFKIQNTRFARITRFTKNYAMFLADFFPQITTLNIVNMTCSDMSKVIHLITIYIAKQSSTLTTIRIVGNFDDDFKPCSYNCCPDEKFYKKFQLKYEGLINVINSVANLKCLMFDVPFEGFHDDYEKVDLPKLAQLEELYFYAYDKDCLLTSMQKYGTKNDRLRNIAISFLDFIIYKFDSLFKFDSKLIACVSRIDVKVSPGNIHKFDKFCTLFHNLTTLHIHVGHKAWNELLESLTKLNKLMNLELEMREFKTLESLAKEEAIKDVAIPNVKRLSIYIEEDFALKSHNIFRDMKLDIIFSNLQVMSLDTWELIDDCDYCKEIQSKQSEKDRNDSGELECQKLLLRPLFDCKKLSLVIVRSHYTDCCEDNGIIYPGSTYRYTREEFVNDDNVSLHSVDEMADESA